MKKILIITFYIFIISISCTYAQRGRVEIENGTLVTDTKTLLRGVFVALDIYSMVDREDVSAIKDYGLNCIHVYAENPSSQTAGDNATDLDKLVEWTKEEDLYLIITIGGGSENGMFDSTFVSNFWKIYAPRYKDETHVIYEIKNEPFAWSSPYDQNTLDMEIWAYKLIRGLAPNTHILLMSYANAINEDNIIEDDIKYIGSSVDWDNASIASHGYATAPQNLRTFIQTIKNAGYAVTFTEPEGVEDIYFNVGSTRVFEEEYASYTHFVSVYRLLNFPARFVNQVKSTDLRWTPDFGTYPLSIDTISYINPFEDRLAVFYDDGYKFAQRRNDGGYYIGRTVNNSYIGYYNLNFESCPETLYLRYSCPNPKGSIEVHLDSIDGIVVGEFPIEESDNWVESVTSSCEINPFEGIHKIYFKINNGHIYWFLNFRSFYFTKAGSCDNFSILSEVNNASPGLNNGSIALIIDGAEDDYSYLWTDGYTGKDRSGLSTGSYSVKVTDSSGCSNCKTFKIEEDPCLNFSVSGKVINTQYGKETGSISMSVSEGESPITYSWEDGVTTKDRTNLSAGSYHVTVVDANGCNESLSFVVEENPIGFAIVSYAPNPTKGLVALIYSSPSVSAIEVIVENSVGKQVKSMNTYSIIGENKLSIDLSYDDEGNELPKGKYQISLNNDDLTSSVNIIKR